MLAAVSTFSWGISLWKLAYRKPLIAHFSHLSSLPFRTLGSQTGVAAPDRQGLALLPGSIALNLLFAATIQTRVSPPQPRAHAPTGATGSLPLQEKGPSSDFWKKAGNLFLGQKACGMMEAVLPQMWEHDDLREALVRLESRKQKKTPNMSHQWTKHIIQKPPS